MKFTLDDIKKELGAKKIKHGVSPKEIDNQKGKTINWLNQQNLMPPNTAIAQALIKFMAETKLGIREKGLFLIGGVGTGKTVALKIISRAREEYEFLQAYDITEKSKTYDSSQACTRDLFRRFNNDKNKHVIIDDVGDELTINNYGVRSEFIAEVIRERHLTFIERGDLTLISSNLGKDAFKDRYNKRIVSRISQMCQIVICNGEDLRER